MISVCMAVYNGEKYIKEQMEAIINQSKQPDELIIYNDASTDDTIKIILEVAEKYKFENKIRIYNSQKNIGYPYCFYQALRLCSGDYIFFSDQDDVWHKDKVKIMNDVMENNEQINVLACCFGLIDEKSNRINSIMKPSHSKESQKIQKVTLKEIFRKYRWPGMVLCVRKSWIDSLKTDFASVDIPHDILFCSMASEEGKMYVIDKELSYHRRHNSNTAHEEYRFKELLNKKRKIEEINTYLNMLREFERHHIFLSEEGQKILSEKTISMKERLSTIESGNIFKVLKNWLKNKKNIRLVTLICDMIIVFQ